MAGLDGYVKLLLHCDGTDASTTFPDSSFQVHTVTANGSAQVDTAQSKFGGAALLIGSAGDNLTVPDSDDWDIWNNDFTIDLWVRWAALPTNTIAVFVNQDDGSGNSWKFQLSYVSFPPFINLVTLQLVGSNTVDGDAGEFSATSLTTPSLDVWYHYAVERYGDVINFYRNGAKQIGSVNQALATLNNVSSSLFIGSAAGGGLITDGHIEELRITNGVARYRGASFTPLTAAYSLTTPDNWYRELAGPLRQRESLGAPSQSFFFYVADLASVAFSEGLNGFRGWFVPLGEPVRIPPRLGTGDQQFDIVTFKPVLRRTKSVAGSHDGNPQLHGVHYPTSQIATKVHS